MNSNVWIQAARPKTLLVSMAPVVVAVSMAIGKGRGVLILPATICFLFAIMAQIISNYVNDYADFIKGTDDETRIGPKRMLASGLITKQSMKVALLVLFGITALLGLSLIYWGGWILLPIGVFIFVGAYSYSAGPYPLSYHGLGDLAVVLFYGFVPVVFTYYVICGSIDIDICLAGFAMGIIADELLIVNNYRDVEQDRCHNKRTTVVLFGTKIAETIFLLNPIIAFALGYIFMDYSLVWSLLGVVFLAYTLLLWRKLKTTKGPALNKLLAMASMMSIFFALMVLISSTFLR